MGGREEDWPEGTKEAELGPDGADSLAKPLQPQYSGTVALFLSQQIIM